MVSIPHDARDGQPVPIPLLAAAELPPAWEQVEAGRYMPRRIKGSFPGRELG